MSKKQKNDLVDNEWLDEEISQKSASASPQSPSGVQLSPIVQPIAFVPYNTQDQPLFQYGGYDVERAKEEIAQEFEDSEEYEEVYEESDSEKKVRFTPIFLAVLSLLVVAVLVVGEFVAQEFLALTAGMSGYAYIMELVDIFTAGGELVIADMIFPGAVGLVGLFAVINFIASLIKMKSRGASVISKICLFFMLTFSLVLTLISLMNDYEIVYGLYAVAGLSLLSLIVGYLAKKE
ncbi:MAG: hypothetical protein ACOCWI_01520 [Bacillota bacterium]